MEELIQIIENSKDLLREKLSNLENHGGLSKEMYCRYLTFQYHLTKGVQKVFMAIAAHEVTAQRKPLRKWLIQFSDEEEFHFKIAESDLKSLGEAPGPIPVDVKQWWLFFDEIIENRPFIRLGATSILENVAGKSGDVIQKMIETSNFLNASNTRFVIIHQHGPSLDHGNQIINILKESNLTESEYADVLYGAELGSAFFMRFINWVINGGLVG